jgi:tetrahydromethanopterin S-methyltransferase subunit F
MMEIEIEINIREGVRMIDKDNEIKKMIRTVRILKIQCAILFAALIFGVLMLVYD